MSKSTTLRTRRKFAPLSKPTEPASRKSTRAAVQKFAKRGVAFSVADIRAERHDLDPLLTHQTIQLELRHGSIERVSRGRYILNKEKMTKREEDAAKRSSRLLQLIDEPRDAAELGAKLGVTGGAVKLQLKPMIADGRIHKRVFGKKVFYARSQEELDRKAALEAEQLKSLSQEILQLLPENIPAARETLRIRTDASQGGLTRSLEELSDRQLIETFVLGNDTYVVLTKAGRQHSLRKEEAERLSPVDWSRTSQSVRIGTFVILDMMKKLTIAEVGAATKILPKGFHPARIHQHVQNLIDEGLLEVDASDTTTPRKVSLADMPTTQERLRRIREFVPYPPRPEIEKTVEEWRADPSRRRRKGERMPT